MRNYLVANHKLDVDEHNLDNFRTSSVVGFTSKGILYSQSKTHFYIYAVRDNYEAEML